MGQTTSKNYPAQIALSENSYTFSNNTPAQSGTIPGVDTYSNDLYAKRKKQLQNLYKKMKSNLEMYMLYDNYDSKNKVILIDLKKKASNQDDELKKILESRDKLMAEFQTKSDNTELYKSKDSTTETLNTILFLILIGTIIFILYKIYTYPIDASNNNNGVDLNKLLDLDSADLNNLSENDLNNLEKAFDAKINQLETSINNTSASNTASANSAKNSVNLSSSNNSVNNITNSNIKKRNKLTLS